jgi:hypothetical protein
VKVVTRRASMAGSMYLVFRVILRSGGGCEVAALLSSRAVEWSYQVDEVFSQMHNAWGFWRRSGSYQPRKAFTVPQKSFPVATTSSFPRQTAPSKMPHPWQLPIVVIKHHLEINSGGAYETRRNRWISIIIITIVGQKSWGAVPDNRSGGSGARCKRAVCRNVMLTHFVDQDRLHHHFGPQPRAFRETSFSGRTGPTGPPLDASDSAR